MFAELSPGAASAFSFWCGNLKTKSRATQATHTDTHTHTHTDIHISQNECISIPATCQTESAPTRFLLCELDLIVVMQHLLLVLANHLAAHKCAIGTARMKQEWSNQKRKERKKKKKKKRKGKERKEERKERKKERKEKVKKEERRKERKKERKKIERNEIPQIFNERDWVSLSLRWSLQTMRKKIPSPSITHLPNFHKTACVKPERSCSGGY